MEHDKFRAWDDENRIWLMGYELLGGFSLCGEALMMGEWAGVLSKYLCSDFTKRDDALKVMCFTHQQDKNQKDIYEGDILSGRHREYQKDIVGEVVWNDDSWALRDGGGRLIEFWNDGSHNWYNLGSFHPQEELEIIGNIHEHPELLKERNKTT